MTWIIDRFFFHTLIVGTGAAGMNCAKKLYEYLDNQGVKNAHQNIALVTAGKGLGASRMSGSDKQTYYKLGTSPDTPDSAQAFAESLTAGGCCHGDLALVEAIGSLRSFYNLVEVGVPFPHDESGAYIGYKTDHDPYERATSAGPKTSRYMSQCLDKIVESYGIQIFDNMEVVDLLSNTFDDHESITGLAAIDKHSLLQENRRLAVFSCNYLVLAGGGPGALYRDSVYPLGQTGLHGLALQAGLAAENITESQFGLSSKKFRWNVSGSYMQVVPRIFSTNEEGGDEKEFLAAYFPSMQKMATGIFLKGYQWPFDPDRVKGYQSSLIDILVYNETSKGRRVFMDFLKNPMGDEGHDPYEIGQLDEEALHYLRNTGANQELPIERLRHLNPQAIEIYQEHGIDLGAEALEIAVCAQHNNGGFAVNKWWQSNVANTFIIGEMAGTHGVKRPGGSALNAGQVGAERAAQYISHLTEERGIRSSGPSSEVIEQQVKHLIHRFAWYETNKDGLSPDHIIKETQERMSLYAGHIRELNKLSTALEEAKNVYRTVQDRGFCVKSSMAFVQAVQAKHVLLASIGYLQAAYDLLKRGGGSRGSYLVVSDDGEELHPKLHVQFTGTTLRCRPENKSFRNEIQQLRCLNPLTGDFGCEMGRVRAANFKQKAFESAWREYRKGMIYSYNTHKP